jgi:diadenosine tetraphosphatase ApaH/serine/threonine PP2A family protein phosphatase
VLFLKGLPLVRDIDGQFLVVHAALHPEPNDEIYLTSSAELSRNLAVLRREGRAKLAFFGHTHLAGVHRLWVTGMHDGRYMSSDAWMQRLHPDSIHLVNPGSVGQPRDGDPRASFLVYDADHATVRFHRVPFDRKAALQKARRAGLMFPGDELLE